MSTRRADIDKVAAALYRRTLTETNNPQLAWQNCYKLAAIAVDALRPAQGRPGPKTKPKPAKTRSDHDRARNPITEADWDLYFQRKQA